jgi:predicted KAP-like P-loop ATPase
MSLFAKPSPDGIPEIKSFNTNRRLIEPSVKEAFLQHRKQSGNIDNDVVEKVRAIINHLSQTCETPTIDSSVKCSCSRMLNNYQNFLKNYTEGKLAGGRRKTSKGRRKNKSRRNRKSRR